MRPIRRTLSLRVNGEVSLRKRGEFERGWIRTTVGISFCVTIGLASVCSYRGHRVASIILFALAGGLWVAYFLLYVRGDAEVEPAVHFEPVSFLVGICFVVVGVWSGITFLPHSANILGVVFFGAVFVAFPIVTGVTVIRRQIRRRLLSAFLRGKTRRS